MRVWAKAAISAALLAALLLLLPWAQVREALGRLPAGVWLGVLSGFAAGHLVGIAKWRLFVNSARAGLRWLDAALCYAAGLFANLCLPSIVGGDVLRLGLAARFTKRPEAALWGGIMDRISDLLALAILVTVGALFARSRLEGWIGQVLLVVLVVGLALLVLLLPLALRRPLSRWPRRLRRPIGRGLVGLRQLIRRPGPALLGLVLSLTIQSGFVLLNAWLGRGVGIEVGLAVWFMIWPLAKIASLLPISLGGLAVREASLAALLLPFGVPMARSVVCSLLWQTVLIAGGLLGGLTWLVLDRVRQIPLRVAGESISIAASRGK